jgi:hypothetical protein
MFRLSQIHYVRVEFWFRGRAMTAARTYRAGGSIEDYCRACKTDRLHTIIVVDAELQPLRVACGYCDSEHNYRGGPRIDVSGASDSRQATVATAPGPDVNRERRANPSASGEPLAVVSERERTGPAMAIPNQTDDLELLLRRIIREEAGISAVVPAQKWRGGQLVLKPGSPGLQDRSWPIETFFHKVVMLRNRLRTLEQQVNASDLPEDTKVKLQSYVSGCYGSLTSFNVLFADEDDQFKGGGD